MPDTATGNLFYCGASITRRPRNICWQVHCHCLHAARYINYECTTGSCMILCLSHHKFFGFDVSQVSDLVKKCVQYRKKKWAFFANIFRMISSDAGECTVSYIRWLYDAMCIEMLRYSRLVLVFTQKEL